MWRFYIIFFVFIFQIFDEADLVISGTSEKDGGLNLGLSLRPNKNAEEGRGKKGNNMGGIMAAAAMKIGLLKALAFKALALLVGKALLVSKVCKFYKCNQFWASGCNGT